MMKTARPTPFLVFVGFVVSFSAACGDASSDGSRPADDVGAPSNDAADDTTGTTDFGDPDGDTSGPSLPVGGELDLPVAPPTTSKPAPTDWVGTALAHPNQFFKRQVRHPVWNPTGPLFSGNCAPTSLAMIAKVFGKEPAGLTIEESIDRVRVMMDKPSDSGGASEAQVRLGASRLGLKYRAMAKGELDTELAQKHMVVLTGYPGLDGTDAASAYQAAFRAAGYYYTFDANHSIAVFGKTSTGRYVVGDPLSKIGVITMTAAQMKDFWARWGGSGTAVWR